VAWAERILQQVDGVFQPTIGTLLIKSNQDLVHLRTIGRLLECQSRIPAMPIRISSFRVARNGETTHPKRIVIALR
jgi:hypothetical protein